MTEPISMKALHKALPEGVWLNAEEALALLAPIASTGDEQFARIDAQAALHALEEFGLVLRDGARVYRPAPDGRRVPGRLSIIHRREKEHSVA